MSGSQAEKPVVAAFDFDGTLTRRETLFLFLIYTLGIVRLMRHALILSPTLLGYALRLIRNDVAKERIFIQCWSGMRIEELQKKGERFATEVLPRLMRSEAMQRLAWHQHQGHRCVVISASLELYVRPWALEAGFNEVIATRLETKEHGLVTGKLQGANCFGIEKARRLEALLGNRNGYTLYAYGDSRGDRELLLLADHAYYRKMI